MRAPGETRPVNTATAQQSVMHVARMYVAMTLFLYNVPRASCTRMCGIAVASDAQGEVRNEPGEAGRREGQARKTRWNRVRGHHRRLRILARTIMPH